MPIIKSGRARAKADTSTLFGWRQAHKDHGAGPQVVAHVHVYDWWLCDCGARGTQSDTGEWRETAVRWAS